LSRGFGFRDRRRSRFSRNSRCRSWGVTEPLKESRLKRISSCISVLLLLFNPGIGSLQVLNAATGIIQSIKGLVGIVNQIRHHAENGEMPKEAPTLDKYDI
jgi:hypothetical protein